jgi:SAM-dependent methyltransferase
LVEERPPLTNSPLYCPQCKKALTATDVEYLCRDCRRSYPIVDGIPQLVLNDITKDSFDVLAFEFLFRMEQKHFWHIGRREMILDIIRGVPGTVDSRILEIGCGNGSVLSFLKNNGLNIEGGDIFLEGLRFCRQRAGDVPLYQIDITALPFKDDFGIICLFDILEHIDDDEKALREVNRALKPGGQILITVPAHQFLWRRADKVAAHKRRYSRKEIIAKLERNGFTIKRTSFFISFLFPLFLGLKAIDIMSVRKTGRDVNSIMEFKTYPVVNGLFLWLLRLENRLIKHVNLPLGASLLVLAEKRNNSNDGKTAGIVALV